jgi:hypothetical protein
LYPDETLPSVVEGIHKDKIGTSGPSSVFLLESQKGWLLVFLSDTPEYLIIKTALPSSSEQLKPHLSLAPRLLLIYIPFSTLSHLLLNLFVYLQSHMRLQSVALGTGLLGATAVSAAKSGLPVDKIYGVNVSVNYHKIFLVYSQPFSARQLVCLFEISV